MPTKMLLTRLAPSLLTISNAQVASGGKLPTKPGAATAVTSPGARTPDWPAQPTTKHTQARRLSGKRFLKKGRIGRKHREPLNYYSSTDNATLTEQQTHCKHMG